MFTYFVTRYLFAESNSLTSSNKKFLGFKLTPLCLTS